MKILLIDDNETNIDCMSLRLKRISKNGILLDSATTFNTAISKLNNNDYDIVFVDGSINKKHDGLTILNHFRNNKMKGIIIACSNGNDFLKKSEKIADYCISKMMEKEDIKILKSLFQ